MARRKSKQSSGRGIPNPTSKRSLPPEVYLSRKSAWGPSTDLELHRATGRPVYPRLKRLPPANLDRRTFHPLGWDRPAVLRDGRPVRRHVIPKSPWQRTLLAQRKVATSVAKAKRATDPWHQLQFHTPLKTLICVQRKTRREVLHALNLSGRNGGGGRRGPHSQVKC